MELAGLSRLKPTVVCPGAGPALLVLPAAPSPGSSPAVRVHVSAHTFASVPTTRSFSSMILSLMEER